MQVHRNISALPSFNKAVVTIGTFDGVHQAHRLILQRLTETARHTGGETVVISFDPHPRAVLDAEKRVPLLNTMDEKIQLLAECGIDHLVLVPFTVDFAQQSAEAYAEQFLIALFKPHTVVIGYDHHFGRRRQGNFRLLETYAAKGAFHLEEIEEQLLQNSAISSTRIRQALLSGDIELANTLLGYPYFFSGTVVKGNQMGRTIGYPTANLELTGKDKLLPAGGVYIVQTKVLDTWHRGMMNIGTRPTVDGTRTVTEVHLLDFDEDIYGALLEVKVLSFIRLEEKFPSLDHLKLQLALDKKATADWFTNHAPEQ